MTDEKIIEINNRTAQESKRAGGRRSRTRRSETRRSWNRNVGDLDCGRAPARVVRP